MKPKDRNTNVVRVCFRTKQRKTTPRTTPVTTLEQNQRAKEVYLNELDQVQELWDTLMDSVYEQKLNPKRVLQMAVLEALSEGTKVDELVKEVLSFATFMAPLFDESE